VLRALEEKKWTDRTTRAKRLEYKRLRKIAHKVCKSKKITHMDNRIRSVEEKIKNKQTRNTHKEVGEIKVSFQPHTYRCRGTTNEILSKEEEIKTRWQTYFQGLLTIPATVDQSTPLEGTYINQAVTEEEQEEEPPDILDIGMAI
jgi:hypothetical protein